jgi:8-oxo-dGTP diphosphatase
MNKKEKPRDNSVIFGIVTKTKKGTLRWYVDNETDDTIIYKASEKIYGSRTKAILYKLFFKKKDPLKTNMAIYLEYRKYKENNFSTDNIYAIENKKIRHLNDSSKLILLTRIILESMGYDVINSVVCAIRRNDEILLVKRHEYDNTIANLWTLPGGKINPNEEISMAMRREVEEETGLIPTEYELLPYKNIIKLGNKYFVVKLYVANNFRGRLKEFPTNELENAKWIKFDDVFNYYIGDETKQILSYYVKILKAANLY